MRRVRRAALRYAEERKEIAAGTALAQPPVIPKADDAEACDEDKMQYGPDLVDEGQKLHELAGGEARKELFAMEVRTKPWHRRENVKHCGLTLGLFADSCPSRCSRALPRPAPASAAPPSPATPGRLAAYPSISDLTCSGAYVPATSPSVDSAI